MNGALSAIETKLSLVYLDEVFVFARPKKEQIGHSKRVLALLRDAAATLKSKTCNFFTETIDNVGHSNVPRSLEIPLLVTYVI